MSRGFTFRFLFLPGGRVGGVGHPESGSGAGQRVTVNEIFFGPVTKAQVRRAIEEELE